jgi:hypothetical protein
MHAWMCLTILIVTAYFSDFSGTVISQDQGAITYRESLRDRSESRYVMVPWMKTVLPTGMVSLSHSLLTTSLTKFRRVNYVKYNQ